jgi:hypothetical protein
MINKMEQIYFVVGPKRNTVDSANPGRSCGELQTVEPVHPYTVSAKPYYLPRSPVAGETSALVPDLRSKPDRRSLFERRSPVSRRSSPDRVSTPERRSLRDRR